MRIFITSALLVLTSAFSAQVAEHYCHTTEAQNEWFAKHPELRAAFDRHVQQSAAQDKIAFQNGYYRNLSQARSSAAAAASNYTIPVVFHILHTGGSENISDAQVIDAVNILTRDFNLLNTDTNDVVVPFKNMIGNPQIEFRLATKDPNGNCTNGIIRHWSTDTDWTSGAFGDYIYSWPSNRYLNVYVVKTISSGAAGYTYLPGSGVPNAADAIVILSTYVGSIGTGGIGTSRALTHEVGHWLDLEHTWGYTNNPGVSCGDDGVSDTPVTKGFNSCNLSSASICNPPTIENMQNYMDYAYCQRMFTLGQSFRMISAINSPVDGRNNLSTPGNLALTGITTAGSGCSTLLDISVTPGLMICSGKTLSLNSFTSNFAPTSYAWSASGGGAVIQNPGSQNTPVSFSTPGTVTISCTVNSPGGNVTKSLTVLVKNGVTDVAATYSESFETSSIPSTWTSINGAGAGQDWQIFNSTGSLGSQCMYVPGELLPANAIQILESPSFDFLNNQGATYSFKCAYAKHNNANKDVIKVQATKNCGGTWVDVWSVNNTVLANASGGITSANFVPANFEWVYYEVTGYPAFNQFKNEANVRFRFYFREDVGGSGFGNRFYLDEVNFKQASGGTGINEMSRAIGFNVYPNPADGAFNMSFTLSDAAKIKYSLTSLTGQVLLSENAKDYATGKHEITINENSSLTPGIYFVNFEMNGVKMNRKLIVH